MGKIKSEAAFIKLLRVRGPNLEWHIFDPSFRFRKNKLFQQCSLTLELTIPLLTFGKTAKMILTAVII